MFLVRTLAMRCIPIVTLILWSVLMTVSLLDLGGLYMDLSEKLESKIDLVTKKVVNEVFKEYIERDLISIYKNG